MTTTFTINPPIVTTRISRVGVKYSVPYTGNVPNAVPILTGFNDVQLATIESWWDEENQNDWVQKPDPEPFVEPVVPNWDGLYTSLMILPTYEYLVGLGTQYPGIGVEMGKVTSAILYGDRRPDSPIAFDAFQSSVNLLFYALGLASQTLTAQPLAEIRTTLDNNGFRGIVLP